MFEIFKFLLKHKEKSEENKEIDLLIELFEGSAIKQFILHSKVFIDKYNNRSNKEHEALNYQNDINQLKESIDTILKNYKTENEIVNALLLKIALDIKTDNNNLQIKSVEILKRDYAKKEICEKLAKNLSELEKVMNRLKELIKKYSEMELLTVNKKEFVIDNEIYNELSKINEILSLINNKLKELIKETEFRDNVKIEFRKDIVQGHKISNKCIIVHLITDLELLNYIKTLKRNYPEIPYLNDFNVYKILWDCQEVIIEEIKNALKEKNNFANANTFSITVKLIKECNGTFYAIKSKIGSCYIEIGLIFGLIRLLEQLYPHDLIMLHKIKEGMFKAPREIMGFRKRDLNQVLIHEMQHYYEFSEQEKNQKEKSPAESEQYTSEYDKDLLSSIKSEGLTRTLDYKKRPWLIYNKSELNETIKKLDDSGKEKYILGFYITYFILLNRYREEYPKEYNQLKATYNAKMTEQIPYLEGFEKILKKSNKIFLQNMPAPFIDRNVETLSKITKEKFFDEYFKAAKKIGVTTKFLIITEKDIKRIEKNRIEEMKKTEKLTKSIKEKSSPTKYNKIN